MYHHCEIIDCHIKTPHTPTDPLDLEGVIAIISNEPWLPASLLAPLRDKAGAH